MAARLHSQYLALNKGGGHVQSPGAPGFFGATGAARLETFGFVGGSWEGIDFGSHSPTEAVRSLFDAPYHRLPFLQPGNVRFGSGFQDQYLTVEFGVGDVEGTVVSPSDGETDVPIQWRNYEVPDPLRAFPGAPKQVGYPIVLVRHGRKPRLGTVEAKLYGPDAEEVECYLTPAPDKAAIILIPRRPLRSKSRYDAVFKERTFLGSERTFRAGFTTG